MFAYILYTSLAGLYLDVFFIIMSVSWYTRWLGGYRDMPTVWKKICQMSLLWPLMKMFLTR